MGYGPSLHCPREEVALDLPGHSTQTGGQCQEATLSRVLCIWSPHRDHRTERFRARERKGGEVGESQSRLGSLSPPCTQFSHQYPKGIMIMPSSTAGLPTAVSPEAEARENCTTVQLGCFSVPIMGGAEAEVTPTGCPGSQGSSRESGPRLSQSPSCPS